MDIIKLLENVWIGVGIIYLIRRGLYSIKKTWIKLSKIILLKQSKKRRDVI